MVQRRLSIHRISGDPIVDERLRDYIADLELVAESGTFIFCPLNVDGALWGMLSIHGGCTRSGWKTSEVDLINGVSGQLSSAIKNSRLYQIAVDGKRRVEASEQYLQKVIASINYGVVAIEQDRRITYANPLLERMLGYTADELRQLDIATLIAPESLNKMQGEFAKRHDGDTGTYELELLNRQGERIPVLISAAPVDVS